MKRILFASVAVLLFAVSIQATVNDAASINDEQGSRDKYTSKNEKVSKIHCINKAPSCCREFISSVLTAVLTATIHYVYINNDSRVINILGNPPFKQQGSS